MISLLARRWPGKAYRFLEDMAKTGCHLPGAGLRMELIEAYPDQTMFNKLVAYTRIGLVPEHIERLTHLAKVRVIMRDKAPSIGFTLPPVTQRAPQSESAMPRRVSETKGTIGGT